MWPIDNDFPQQEANEIAQREAFNRHLYRPNTYLHKWWARRSGTLFRYILKGFVTEHEKQPFVAPGGLEGRVVFDPMMGGGTTLHEAIRLGANVIGVDIDPIPVVQARATLTFLPLEEKRDIFTNAFHALREHLAPWFETKCPICGSTAEIQFVLYARRRQCNCGSVLFLDDFMLLDANSSQERVQICPYCGIVYRGEHKCLSHFNILLSKKNSTNCPRCGMKYVDFLDEPYWQRYYPIALKGNCEKGHEFFKNVDEADKTRIQEAEAAIQTMDFGSSEMWQIPGGPKSRDLLRLNISSFLELFSPRQLLYLQAAKEVINSLPREHRLWFTLLISTSLEFNSMLSGYKGQSIRRPGAVRHVFSHHAYTIPYTALENNPIFSQPRSGTLLRLFRDRIEKASRWASLPIERQVHAGKVHKVSIVGEIDGGTEVSRWDDIRTGQRKFMVIQADASQMEIPKEIADFVVTDPPYYDNVQYGDLSHFFRIWLHFLLPQEANWEYNPLFSAVSQNGFQDAQKYMSILSGIWEKVAYALKKPHGRLVFTFHHWRPEAWAALTISLRKVGFTLVNRYVVASENPLSVHIQGLQALKHDAILVLVPPGGNAPPRIWSPVSKIVVHDSEAFVQACSEALGWLLSAHEIPLEEIWEIWRHILEVA